jgi:hypothetical protein
MTTCDKSKEHARTSRQPRQLNENKSNLMRFWHIKIIMGVSKKMSLWFVSDRWQEHQQDHASPHGRNVDHSGPGHVSYYCDEVHKCYSWSFSVCKNCYHLKCFHSSAQSLELLENENGNNYLFFPSEIQKFDKCGLWGRVLNVTPPFNFVFVFV